MTPYKTSDIVLAAFLRLSGCQMLGIEKQGSKGTFVFTEVDDELIRPQDGLIINIKNRRIFNVKSWFLTSFS